MELEAPTSWTALASAPGRRDEAARPSGGPAGLLVASDPTGENRSRWAIGPEGGFTEPEVALAAERGWQVVGLGATLLGIETAGLAGSAAILALCGSSER